MQLLNLDHLRILDSISQGAVILRDGVIRHANTCFAGLCRTGQGGLPGSSNPQSYSDQEE